MTSVDRFTLDEVARALPAVSIYRWRAPRYQWRMLNHLAEQWDGPHAALLDVGGGTGLVAQAIQKLFAPTGSNVYDSHFFVPGTATMPLQKSLEGRAGL